MSADILFETKSTRWFVELEHKDHSTTATVFGMRPKFAQALSAGASAPTASHEEFTVTESNQDTLFERVRAEIEKRDGPILQVDDDPDDAEY